jgi:hypothetical protein
LAALATSVEQISHHVHHGPDRGGQDPAARCTLSAAAPARSTSAMAHGFSSVVYVDMRSPEKGHVAVTMGLEYDLLVVSAADAEHDDRLFRQGTPAFNDHDPAKEVAALRDHAAAVMAYINQRQSLKVKDGTACTPSQSGGFRAGPRDGTDYATVTVDYKCPESGGAHVLTSKLFPDSEGYVRGTKTIVTYEEIDLHAIRRSPRTSRC